MTDRLAPDAGRSDIERRVANTIWYGVIAEADYARARVRVRAGETLTDWIPFATARAGGDRTWHPVEVGEQVLLAAPHGDLRQAVVMGAVNSSPNPAPGDRATLSRTVYEDGTSITYDREAHSYSMDVNAAGTFTLTLGDATITAENGKLTLSAGGSTIEISGGGVAITSAALAHNGTNVGDDHVHIGVAPGPATTGPPA
jgi:phage baseplate assembly protein V